MTERCEWDPEMDRPAQMWADGSEYSGCHRQVEVIVGADGQWHLCAQCAALPRFNRFKVRTERSGQHPSRFRVDELEVLR